VPDASLPPLKSALRVGARGYSLAVLHIVVGHEGDAKPPVDHTVVVHDVRPRVINLMITFAIMLAGVLPCCEDNVRAGASQWSDRAQAVKSVLHEDVQVLSFVFMSA